MLLPTVCISTLHPLDDGLGKDTDGRSESTYLFWPPTPHVKRPPLGVMKSRYLKRRENLEISPETLSLRQLEMSRERAIPLPSLSTRISVIIAGGMSPLMTLRGRKAPKLLTFLN